MNTKRYHFSRNFRIFWGAIAWGMVGGLTIFLYGALHGWLGEQINGSVAAVMACAMIVVIVLSWWVEIQGYWIEVNDAGLIRIRGLFGIKEFHVDDLAGFDVAATSSGEHFVLEANTNEAMKRKVVAAIPMNLDGQEEINRWLGSRLTDLGKKQRAKERKAMREAMLAENPLATGSAQRRERAHLVADILSGAAYAGIPLGVWAAFTKAPWVDVLALVFVLLVPVAALCARAAFPHTTRYDGNPSGEYALLPLPY